MSERRAIVTLILGERFQTLWERFCRANWESYAARHGADLYALDQGPDTTPRAMNRQMTWQKLLILGLEHIRDYDQVVWIDSDILIHPRAGWIGEHVPPALVGAADEYSYPTPELHTRALRRLYRLWATHNIPYEDNATARDFYRVAGYDREFDRAVQSGILVLSPRHHREVLEHVYYSYEQLPLRGLRAEMRPLSYELLKADKVHWLEPRWHARWLIAKTLEYPFLFTETRHPLLAQCTTRTLANNYMLHFAGSANELPSVDLGMPLFAEPPRTQVYPVPTPDAPTCRTPVALFLFNRPETTARVMQAIRRMRPTELYLIADGPRPGIETDIARCAEARAVAQAVDWECVVKTDFADTNMGLKTRVESGLDRLFSQTDRAIILEDDCVPDATFFAFCDEMLERYADDERIFAVCGSDHKFGLTDDANSYTFSRYPLIWGWATWRRAWRLNDPQMKTLPDALRENRLAAKLGSTRAAQYWGFVLNDNLTTGTTWDYPWLWTIWEHEGLCIHPNVNLVENIGFGTDATHTLQDDNPLAEVPSKPMSFPLTHPKETRRDVAGDEIIEEIAFSGTVRRMWENLRVKRAARKQAAVPAP